MNPTRHCLISRLILIAAMIAGVFMTGCNTLRGLGQDTERAGEKIQEKASR